MSATTSATERGDQDSPEWQSARTLPPTARRDCVTVRSPPGCLGWPPAVTKSTNSGWPPPGTVVLHAKLRSLDFAKHFHSVWLDEALLGSNPVGHSYLKTTV